MSGLRAALQAALERDRAEQAWDLGVRAFDEGDAQARMQARRLLLAIAGRVPEGAWTEARATQARRLHVPRAPVPARVGLARFPAVNAAGGGTVVEVQVGCIDGPQDRLPDGAIGPDAEARGSMRVALDAARAQLGRPHQRFEITLPRPVRWSGRSAALAVGLAASSAAAGRAISPRIVATGGLGPDGQIEPVGRLLAKLLLLAELQPLARMLVPRAEDPGDPLALPVASLGEAFDLAIDGPAMEDPVAAWLDAHKQDALGNWSAAAQIAARILDHPETETRERFDLLVMLLQAANHAARPDLAERWLTELEAQQGLDAADTVREVTLARAMGGHVVARVDALDVEGATAALARAEARPWQARLRVHLLGPAALLATLSGEHERALALREEAIAVAEDDERPRCAGDLADAWTRMGEPARALAELDGVQPVSRRAGYQDRTSRYLQLHRARALAALGEVSAARRALRDPLAAEGLDPRLRAQLALAELDGDQMAARALAAQLSAHRGSAVLGALLDRGLGRLGDAEARARLLALPALAGLSFEEACRRLPY